MNRGRQSFPWILACACWLIIRGIVATATAEPRPTGPEPHTETSRIERLEDRLQAVIDENQRLATEVRELREQQGMGRGEFQMDEAGGCNWFPLDGRSNLRVTLDAAWVLRSAAQQSRTDYVAGETGFLLRTQITTSF